MLLALNGWRLAVKSGPPPEFTEPAWPSRAVWRQDGGQNLSPEGTREPSALARMALGCRVDPGRASQRELMSLPGLGPGRAAKIIKWREQGQADWAIRDLGLNESAWRELGPYIKSPD